MRKRLWDLSLVGHDDQTGEPFLTRLGVEALAAATHEPQPGAGERMLKIGQLVRYVGQSVNEIPYGTFGIVAEYENNPDWYGVSFFDIEGVRSVKNIVLQSVKPENVNRVESELVALRRQLAEAESEKAKG